MAVCTLGVFGRIGVLISVLKTKNLASCCPAISPTKGRFLLSGRFSVSAVGLYQLANCEAAVSKRVGVIGFGAYHLGVLSITVRRWDDSTQSHGAAGLFLSCFFV
jgi:hypothetical protein